MADTQNPVYVDGTTITGDGTEEHPLAGAPGGVTSLNALTGAVVLESLDGSINITEIGQDINLEVANAAAPSKFLSYPQGLAATNFATVNFSNTAIGLAANHIVLFPIFLPYAVAAGSLFLDILGDDANNWDLGIYDVNGNLLVSLGATVFVATGAVQTAFKQGTVTLPPGMYWFAVTVNGAPTMTVEGWAASSVEPWSIFNSLSTNPGWFHTSTVSVGGVLPATIVAPAPVAATNISQSSLVTDPGSRPTFALTSY